MKTRKAATSFGAFFLSSILAVSAIPAGTVTAAAAENTADSAIEQEVTEETVEKTEEEPAGSTNEDTQADRGESLEGQTKDGDPDSFASEKSSEENAEDPAKEEEAETDSPEPAEDGENVAPSAADTDEEPEHEMDSEEADSEEAATEETGMMDDQTLPDETVSEKDGDEEAEQSRTTVDEEISEQEGQSEAANAQVNDEEPEILINSPDGDLDPGETATFKILFNNCSKEGYTFEWQKCYEADWSDGFQTVEDAVTEEYSFTAEKTTYIRCYVRKGDKTLTFYSDVSVKGPDYFRVYGVEGEDLSHFIYKEIAPGESVHLQVSAQAFDGANITYKWYKETDDGKELIGNAQNSDLTLNPDRTRRYLCVVREELTDQSDTVYFNVKVNHLNAYQNESRNDNWGEISISANEEFTLTTFVEGDDLSQLTYQWYTADEIETGTDEKIITGATSPSYTGILNQEKWLLCIIKDQYGNSRGVYYHMAPRNNASVNTASVTNATITGISDKVFTGKAITQTLIVRDGATTLKNGTDYTVSYKNNINAGTATAVITGKGSYTGTVTKTFTIAPKNVSSLTIRGIVDKTYNGTSQTQAVVVKDGATTLKRGTDYTVYCKNNTNAGTASVVIAGKGNYKGAVTKTFTIAKAANKITASNFTRSYSTKAQSFLIGEKVTGGKRTYKSDKNRVKVDGAGKVTLPAKFTGTVKITITAGDNNYQTAAKTIKIVVPTMTKLSGAKNTASKKITAKWKKNTKVTGYQIQYSLKSSFKGSKKVTIKKNSTTSKVIKGLKQGKKYYVRIRSFKTVGGKKYYSAWSAKKIVTVK